MQVARDTRRLFDAVVVGEFERAFSARQFWSVAGTLARHEVQVWLPEVDGLVDPADPVHRALVTVLGAKARHEVVRARHRTVAAMRAQTVEQGRFLGGRPPYGYRFVDAGPHPNRAVAAWGKRLHRLDPDSVTATHVRWMFVRRLQGRSRAGIARELNDRGVPCPSQDASTLRVVAEHADLWNIASGDIADAVRRSAPLDRLCAEIGRAPVAIIRPVSSACRRQLPSRDTGKDSVHSTCPDASRMS